MRDPHELRRQVREIQQEMPDHLGATLTASNYRDNPIGRVDGMEQVIVRMENVVPEMRASPRGNVRHQSGPEHDVLCTDRPAVDLQGEALPIDGGLTHLRAKLNVG